MAKVATEATFQCVTLGNVLRHLPQVPPERIRLDPKLGTANEQDVLDVRARDRR